MKDEESNPQNSNPAPKSRTIRLLTYIAALGLALGAVYQNWSWFKPEWLNPLLSRLRRIGPVEPKEDPGYNLPPDAKQKLEDYFRKEQK